MRYTGLALLLLFFLPACFFKRADSPVVARVGDFIITQKMIEERDRINRLENPGETTSLGLAQLKKAYVDAQILTILGVALDDAVLLGEEKRINETTQMPEKLKQIKEIFGGRTADYRRVFVLPVYAQRTIYYDFFLNDMKVQAVPLKVAGDFFAVVTANPSRWAAAVREGKIKTNKFLLSEKNGLRVLNAGEDPQPVPLPGTAPALTEEVAALKPGQVLPRLLNEGETGWLVIRYLKPGRETGNYELEFAVFPKLDYETWHREQAARVVIQ